VNDAMWREDIEQLKNELPRLHSDFFYTGNEDEFFARIEALRRDLDEMSTYDIVLEMARIVATARDAHTTVVLPQNYRLPFDCYPFAEGLYITATDEANQILIHGKILQIGEADTADVYKAVAEITPHENMQFVLACLPKSITCVDILYGLGIVEYVDSVDITVLDREGNTARIEITPVKYADYQPVKPTVPHLPLYRQREDQFYWSALQDGVFYINYNKCRNMEAPEASVSEFCDQLIEELSDNREVEKVVIDLRHNTGGNSELFKPFLQWLSANEALNQRGKLFVIVGRDTFSSASLNMFFLRYNTEAIFVGEPTGGKPNHFGEVKYLDLKHSGLYIRYSTKYYHLIEDDQQLSFVPDIQCPVSFEDYADLVDRCMLEIEAYKT
jgi:C-terminal processing protease CtpA/Prc